MRTSKIIEIDNIEQIKDNLLQWSQQFQSVAWLDSNNYDQNNIKYDAILAVDQASELKICAKGSFKALKSYQSKVKDWVFGYLTYDLKNDIENLQSNNFDGLEFPELYFFQPKRLFLIKDKTIEIKYLKELEQEIDNDLLIIKKLDGSTTKQYNKDVKIKLRIHKDDYFNKITKLLQHIYRGDIYEANFCQEFYAKKTQINPLQAYKQLNSISCVPFASFLKQGHNYLLSASPERYLKKEGLKVLSQPIKGTAKRSSSYEEDLQLKINLENDSKERSENIMIVDLVRNDLSQTAIKGSVKVEELCKVYSFKQVHQMISTVSTEISKNTHPVDVIKTTFPMGSMTGAPKISAMQIIEDLEETKRGLYSGAVGYFTPDNDFDFNVIIRSILYNAKKQYVSYSVGSAITAQSNPINEYEECLIKAKAMREVLEGEVSNVQMANSKILN